MMIIELQNTLFRANALNTMVERAQMWKSNRKKQIIQIC